MRRKSVGPPPSGNPESSRRPTDPIRAFVGAGSRFFTLLGLLLFPAWAGGQGTVRIIGQKFDFREFRFDVTLQSARPDLKLTEVGFYNFTERCTEIPYSPEPEITLKSQADYRIDMPWVDGPDTVLAPANPVLALPENKKIRFTIGLGTEPTDLLDIGCITLATRPVLVFSDGSRLALEEVTLASEDFIDYVDQNIPTDSRLQREARDSDPDIRSNAARMLCKSTLPKSALRPIVARLLEDPDAEVRSNAMVSAGRLRYDEYTPFFLERSVKAVEYKEAYAGLLALKSVRFNALTPLVVGRFDTTRMDNITRLCGRWLKRNDLEKSAYDHVPAKLSANFPIAVKLACLSLTEAWKIREAGDPLFTLLADTRLDDDDARNVARTIVSLGDTAAAAKALALLQPSGAWLSPEQEVYARSLLRVILGYDYRPAIPLLQELLRPAQPARVTELTLGVFMEKCREEALDADGNLAACMPQACFQAVKPAVSALIGQPSETLKKDALKLYCFLVLPGSTPSREDMILNLLPGPSASGRDMAVDVVSELGLKSLAPDLCALLKKTTDVSFRARLEDVLKNALNYSCP